jgi:hypothetical protein
MNIKNKCNKFKINILTYYQYIFNQKFALIT